MHVVMKSSAFESSLSLEAIAGSNGTKENLFCLQPILSKDCCEGWLQRSCTKRLSGDFLVGFWTWVSYQYSTDDTNDLWWIWDGVVHHDLFRSAIFNTTYYAMVLERFNVFRMRVMIL
uniref:Uncharacterized protein n=1 Tax=Micrurus surinamensis TaxID=129470 RepID=A0A2D4NPY5_MICSU